MVHLICPDDYYRMYGTNVRVFKKDIAVATQTKKRVHNSVPLVACRLIVLGGFLVDSSMVKPIYLFEHINPLAELRSVLLVQYWSSQHSNSVVWMVTD